MKKKPVTSGVAWTQKGYKAKWSTVPLDAPRTGVVMDQEQAYKEIKAIEKQADKMAKKFVKKNAFMFAMKHDDCPICQAVDDLAPSKSYCPDHKYMNERSPMKQDDVREEIDAIVCMRLRSEYDCDKVVDAILKLISTSLLQKMEGLKKKCGGDLQMNDEYEQCHGWNAALSDCIAIVKDGK